MISVGSTIADRYVVQQRLGAGGFGVVHECWDTKLERSVAIKLGPRPEDDGSGHRRFLREGRMMAEVSTPGTVLLYDFGVAPESGRPFLTMERLKGETLGQRMRRDPPALGEVMGVMFDLLVTLTAFHGRGIVHRDLKPENVFLHAPNPGERVVKILDFGLARPTGDRERITEDDEIVGTPMYMAPEVVLGREVDPRADLFSVGSLLLELLTGRDPLSGRTKEPVAVQMFRAARLPRPRLRQSRPDLPGHLEDVIARALALDPEARFATARDFLYALMDSAGRLTVETEASRCPRPVETSDLTVSSRMS
ncbi:MAG: serine/threonine protein kinase [Myxococcales bacterium]|nr:serine/threonine protein kinase [Myxococcales bacterium]